MTKRLKQQGIALTKPIAPSMVILLLLFCMVTTLNTYPLQDNKIYKQPDKATIFNGGLMVLLKFSKLRFKKLINSVFKVFSIGPAIRPVLFLYLGFGPSNKN
jgi:hypothetical protein